MPKNTYGSTQLFKIEEFDPPSSLETENPELNIELEADSDEETNQDEIKGEEIGELDFFSVSFEDINTFAFPESETPIDSNTSSPAKELAGIAMLSSPNRGNDETDESPVSSFQNASVMTNYFQIFVKPIIEDKEKREKQQKAGEILPGAPDLKQKRNKLKENL